MFGGEESDKRGFMRGRREEGRRSPRTDWGRNVLSRYATCVPDPSVEMAEWSLAHLVDDSGRDGERGDVIDRAGASVS